MTALRSSVEQGLAAALLPKPSPRLYRCKLDGEQEAGPSFLALACSRPPHGKRRWALRLLAARMVELEHDRRKMGCLPPKPSAAFVSHREDVLAVSHRPHDPRHPMVCLDETFTPLIGARRELLSAAPGRVERPTASSCR